MAWRRWPRRHAPASAVGAVDVLLATLPRSAPAAVAAVRYLDHTLAELAEVRGYLADLRDELDRVAAELTTPCPECLEGLGFDETRHTCLAPYPDDEAGP